MVRPAKSLRIRIAEDGSLRVALSASSGEFFLTPEVLHLLCLLQKGSDKGLAKKLKEQLREVTSALPNDDEIALLVSDLVEAGVCVDTSKAAGRALQQEGFGDPWVQWTMLADSQRTLAYARAIGEKVTSSSVVVDVGAGSGVLSAAALSAGAKKVYAIEETDIAKSMRSTLKPLELPLDKLSIFHGNSADFPGGDDVDLVLSELFGNDPFQEGVLPTLRELSARLPQKATYIPKSVTCYLELIDLVHAPMKGRIEALVSASSGEFHKGSSFEDKFYGSFMRAAHESLDFSSVSFAYWLREGEFTSAAESKLVGEVSLSPPPSPANVKIKKTIRFQAKTDVNLPVLQLWFRASLTDRVTISSHPLEKDFANHWSPILVPLRCRLKSGDEVEVKAALNANEDAIEIEARVGNKLVGGR